MFSTPLQSVRAVLVTALLLLCTALIPMISIGADPAVSVKKEAGQLVYDSDSQTEYNVFFAPVIAKSAKGKLLAFAEGRIGSSRDGSAARILLRTSDDEGRTWSDMTIVQGDGKKTIGNASPVVDHDTGIIWLFFCRDVKEIWLTHSSDEGKSWSPAVNMSDDLKRHEHYSSFGPGPGHGIQLTLGEKAGRLLVTGYAKQQAIENNTQGSKSLGIYSDDHGKSWHTGGSTKESAPGLPDGNECMAAELSDGSLYMTIRNNTAKGGRAYARSTDGGSTWLPIQLESNLPEPVCQASILQIPHTNGKMLHAYVAPSHTALGRKDKSARRELSLWLSADDCHTWKKSVQIDPGFSGYSDLVNLEDNDLGCLYAAGKERAYEKVWFVRLNVSDAE